MVPMVFSQILTSLKPPAFFLPLQPFATVFCSPPPFTYNLLSSPLFPLSLSLSPLFLSKISHHHHENGKPFFFLFKEKLFPFADIFKWVSYGHDGKHPGCDQSYFGRREFSFTLENDIYLRFQSFNNVLELENSIKEKCPFKIDIGLVYTVDPAKRHAYAQSDNNVFAPVERELIFDIDISDYDDVRYCCTGADVCLECWPLMTIAIKVIDTALRGSYLYFI